MVARTDEARDYADAALALPAMRAWGTDGGNRAHRG